MDWTRAIDAYCERIDASYWSEPVNAVTNIAFIVMAFLMWRRTKGLSAGRWLSVVLCAIGIGSFLFHIHATPWSSMLDVIPIAAFTLTFIYLANRDFWSWSPWIAAAGTLAFIPYAAVMTQIFARLPFFSVSSVYWALPLLIAGYGVLLWKRAPQTGRGLVLGAGLLSVSIVFRSVDETVCASIPIGTHFVWHLLNAAMLGWMIEVWRCHKIRDA